MDKKRIRIPPVIWNVNICLFPLNPSYLPVSTAPCPLNFVKIRQTDIYIYIYNLQQIIIHRYFESTNRLPVEYLPCRGWISQLEDAWEGVVSVWRGIVPGLCSDGRGKGEYYASLAVTMVTIIIIPY